MPEWIRARDALRYIGSATNPFDAGLAICRRAHVGGLASKAARLMCDDKERLNCFIPNQFWWAEGHEALEQEWEVGDFSTSIDRKEHWRAFDVSFDFMDLREMIPAEARTAALRTFSVSGSDDWLPSIETRRIAYSRVSPKLAGEAILEQCRSGHVVGRALRMSISGSDESSIEWDIPVWFWRDFTIAGKSAQDWQTGRFTGRGRFMGSPVEITLQGVYFHRPSLGAFVPCTSGGAPKEAETTKRGRKSEYDWTAATNAIWGKLARGELIPKVQADIEEALIEHLTVGDKMPSISSARPYAKPIWQEFQKP